MQGNGRRSKEGEESWGGSGEKRDGLSEAEAPGWVCRDRFLGSPGALELHPVKTGKPQEALRRSNVGGKKKKKSQDYNSVKRQVHTVEGALRQVLQAVFGTDSPGARIKSTCPMPSACRAGARAQGFVHAGQQLYPLSDLTMQGNLYVSKGQKFLAPNNSNAK